MPLFRLRSLGSRPVRPLFSRRRLGVLVALLVGLLVSPLGLPAAARAASPPATAPELAAKALDPAFEQQVLAVIRRHPAVLIEALNAYERDQQEAQRRQQAEKLRRLYPQPRDLIGDSPSAAAARWWWWSFLISSAPIAPRPMRPSRPLWSSTARR